MSTLVQIWQGYFQYGLLQSGQTASLIVDVVLVAVGLYFLIQLINSRPGLIFLSLAGGGLVALILTDLFALPGLHLVAQAWLILLLISFPLLFRDAWLSLFKRDAEQPATVEPVLTPVWQGVVAALGAVLIVAVASGVTVRVDKFPQGIPLTAAALATGESASFGSASTVSILISAPRSSWQNLTTSSFSAVVNTGGQGEGTYDLPVSVNSKVSNVKILAVTPSQVATTIEPVIKKTVPVVARISGTAGNGLIADTPQFDPNSVDITGPKSVITDLTEITAPIHLNGETTTINQKVDLRETDAEGNPLPQVSVSPSTVNLTLNLVKGGNLKTLAIRPQLTGSPATGFWVSDISLNPAVVAVTGSVDQLSNLTQISTDPITLTGVNVNTEKNVNLSLPSGVSIADNTTTIDVKISITSSASTKTVVPQLSYSGLADSLKVTTTSPTSISAIVSGPTSALNSLADSQVIAKLDLSAYKSAGTYSVTLTNSSFTLPNSLGLVSFLPSAINVTLDTK